MKIGHDKNQLRDLAVDLGFEMMAHDAMSEREKINRDLLLYGEAVSANGVHIPGDRVSIERRSKDATQRSSDALPTAACSGRFLVGQTM